jgi:hypothetical protein
MIACSSGNLSNSSSATAPSTPAEAKSYESILGEYTQKLQAATPRLIDEYNAAAANNDKGITGLAQISNDKISELAKILNDGIQEMAEIMLTTGSGSYGEYEEWATKLTDVYMTEAQKVTDAYMASAR